MRKSKQKFVFLPHLAKRGELPMENQLTWRPNQQKLSSPMDLEGGKPLENQRIEDWVVKIWKKSKLKG